EPELRQLFYNLSKQAERADLYKVLNACSQIRDHFQAKSASSSSSSSVTLQKGFERPIYYCLLKCFGHHGYVKEAIGVLEDMKSYGLTLDIESLNFVLQGAVVAGSQEHVEDVLEMIQQLGPNPPTEGLRQDSSQHLIEQEDPIRVKSSEKEQEGEEGKLDGEDGRGRDAVILPREMTRNWTSSTYSILMEHCLLNHNLEYGLALMASSIRSNKPLQFEAMLKLIWMSIHAKEVRLAAELAILTEKETMRNLPPSSWMNILRACSEAFYLPGIELAWQKAVVEGLLIPDEGLVLSILAVTAREGCPQFSRIVLDSLNPSPISFSSNSSSLEKVMPSNNSGRFGKRSSPSPTSTPQPPPPPPPKGKITLQEWHLSPLFESQCVGRDFEGAIRTLSIMKSHGHQLGPNLIHQLSIACYKAGKIQETFRKLVEIGRDEDPLKGGVDISSVNALMSASVWSGDLDLAVEIYEVGMTLYDSVRKDERNPPPPSVPKRIEDRCLVQPNLETYHILLSGCIDHKDRKLGQRVLRDIVQSKLKPNEITYERMIILCLTQESYEDSFGFLEQAKMEDIFPTRKSYEAMIRRCHGVGDERWRLLYDEMVEAGYRPGRSLRDQLGEDAEVKDGWRG
ncbi:hypothetical protein IE53DRAFT_318903, partial [Violaceomyces palustris]